MKLGAYDDTYILFFFFFYQSSEAVLGTGGRCPRWHFSEEVSGRQMPRRGQIFRICRTPLLDYLSVIACWPGGGLLRHPAGGGGGE